MIYATPQIPPHLDAQLDELDALRTRLGDDDSTFSPWLGTLRRSVRSKTVESSISIEGFDVSGAEALALLDEGSTAGDDEDRQAFACYARAMDHVGVMATDPWFSWSDRVVLDLHFDACYFQKDKSPGHWRTGPILVTEGGGGVAYRGPEGDQVRGLMGEVIDWLRAGDPDVHPVVRAAMAHLHVVSVHPFRDGNGRVGRIVQSLALALDERVSPEFGSIEEYLAEHTSDYYAALQEVQEGAYQPDRSALPWVGFCIDAHLAQAKQRLRQMTQAAARWEALEKLTADRRWPDRLVIAMEQCLAGGTGSGSYRREADVSAPTASADFRRLLDAGLAEQRGKGRGTRYVASAALREAVSRASD